MSSMWRRAHAADIRDDNASAGFRGRGRGGAAASSGRPVYQRKPFKRHIPEPETSSGEGSSSRSSSPSSSSSASSRSSGGGRRAAASRKANDSAAAARQHHFIRDSNVVGQAPRARYAGSGAHQSSGARKRSDSGAATTKSESGPAHSRTPELNLDVLRSQGLDPAPQIIRLVPTHHIFDKKTGVCLACKTPMKQLVQCSGCQAGCTTCNEK